MSEGDRRGGEGGGGRRMERGRREMYDRGEGRRKNEDR